MSRLREINFESDFFLTTPGLPGKNSYIYRKADFNRGLKRVLPFFKCSVILNYFFMVEGEFPLHYLA